MSLSKFHIVADWAAKGILFGWILAQACSPPLVLAQDNGCVVEGVVRDAAKHPLAGVKVSLDDQVEGRSQSTQTNGEGHFRFTGIGPGTYLLRAKKGGFVDQTAGPFTIRRSESKSLNLQMAEDKVSSSTRNADYALEYSDEPQFTVAGVTDPSNVGGHGSNVTLPTKESLARETASLAGSAPSTRNHTEPPKTPAGELPKISPDDFARNLKVGQDFLRAGQSKQAIPYLEHAAQQKPMDYEAGFSLASAYQKNGETQRADQAVQTLLARGDRSELHALLAEVKESEGQPVEAAREHQRAAEMEPSEENLFAWGAELLLHHADAPASEVLAKAHRLYPNSVRVLVGLGSAAYAQDLNEQAARWLLQAIQLDPADPRPYLFLGKVQEVAKSEPQEWLEAFHRYASLRPEDAPAHYYYAVALEKQRRGERDYAAREAELRKAIAIDPRMGEAYLKLGLLYQEKGDFAEAVAALQKAADFTDLPDEAHLRLAQVYRRMGEAEKARQESAIYQQFAAKKKEKLEKERKELGEFVITAKP
jgi:tetratricopeptide (TPR) repeat protein